MREFKFRVWIPYHKTMIYSDNVPDMYSFICGTDGNLAIEIITWNPEEECYNGARVIGSVQMQYIGLKDKNGKKDIYEGDIVKWHNGIGDVYFDKDHARFEVRGYYNQSSDYPTIAFDEYESFEVIGNIYENPTLLPAKV